MTQPEFLAWVEFYKREPFDDFHRHHRPAALVARSIAGGEIQPLLDWLQPDPRTAGMSDADLNTLRAFGFKRKAT
jgi:hypothetical protein